MTRLPKLLEQLVAENEEAETMIDGAQAAAIDDLAKRIPKIIGLLPDIFFRGRSTDERHPAALEEMTKDLLKLAERANPDLLVSIIFFFEHPVFSRYSHTTIFFLHHCSLKFNDQRLGCWMGQLKSTLHEGWDTRDSYKVSQLNLYFIYLSYISYKRGRPRCMEKITFASQAVRSL